MRCTRCHGEIKPVVAVDIDGTLGNYHGHFLNFAMEYLDIGGTIKVMDKDMAYAEDWPYRGDIPYRDWFCGMFDVDLTTFREIKLAYRAGAQKRTMPVYQDAKPLMDSLVLMNVEVWLTTTRPYLRLDGIDKDTREWLRRNKIMYEYLLYDEEKYRILAENVGAERVVAVLDDEPAQLRQAGQHIGPTVPILRRTRYNNAAQWGGASCLTLMEGLELIANRLQDWRGAHANP